jgi:hypothetical protein
MVGQQLRRHTADPAGSAVEGKAPGQELASGDLVVFASVGVGMNANSMKYRMP